MAKSTGAPVVIIKKVRKGHAAHHGGSWKVAYADFVTAMMAFFMVMWVVGMDDNTKRAIEGYFSNPVGFKKGAGTGSSPISAGTTPLPVRPDGLRLISRVDEARTLENAGEAIRTKMHGTALDSLGAEVQVVVTESGLRIELGEGTRGDVFFPLGSAEMRPAMQQVLTIIASEVVPLPNSVIFEGHTDAAQYAGSSTERYSNWELAADRANAARRALQRSGLLPVRVKEVRGLADRQLKLPGKPYDPRNRRVTILIPFESLPAAARPDSAMTPRRGFAPERTAPSGATGTGASPPHAGA